MQIQPTSEQVRAVTGTAPTTMTSPPPTPALNGTLGGISSMLGMNVSSVQSALKQGQSITDLAQQQGVSRSSLVSFVESQIQQKRQASGQAPLDAATLDRLVNRAFDHHRRHGAAVSSAAAGATGSTASYGSSAVSPPGGTAGGTGFSLLA